MEFGRILSVSMLCCLLIGCGKNTTTEQSAVKWNDYTLTCEATGKDVSLDGSWSNEDYNGIMITSSDSGFGTAIGNMWDDTTTQPIIIDGTSYEAFADDGVYCICIDANTIIWVSVFEDEDDLLDNSIISVTDSKGNILLQASASTILGAF